MVLRGLPAFFLLSAAAAAQPRGITLIADEHGAASPLARPWTAFVDGGAAEAGLSIAWQDALRGAAAECGFQGVRLGGLYAPGLRLPDANDAGGGFTYADDVIDRVVALNLHPVLELPNRPAAVAALVRHLSNRYNAAEIRQWEFEVEEGRPEEYAAMARMLRQIDSRLTVGPALNCGADPHFARGRDWLTAARAAGAAVDFISLAQVKDPLSEQVALARSALAAQGWGSAAVNIVRWPSTPPTPDFSRDESPMAAYVLKANLASIDGVASVAYWRLCDLPADRGPLAGILRGGPGLVTFQGIVKPVYHAYRFLNALGDEVLAAVPGGLVTRRRQSDRLVALAYNYPPEAPAVPPPTATLAEAEAVAATGSSCSLSITLTGLKPDGQILIEWVDARHANAAEAWREMGSPETPGRQALESLRSSARASVIEYRQSDDAGRFTDSRTLPAWGLLLLREL